MKDRRGKLFTVMGPWPGTVFHSRRLISFLPRRLCSISFRFLFYGTSEVKNKKKGQQGISYVPTRAIPSFKMNLRTNSTQPRTISIKPKPTFLYFSLYSNFLCTSSYPFRGVSVISTNQTPLHELRQRHVSRRQ